MKKVTTLFLIVGLLVSPLFFLGNVQAADPIKIGTLLNLTGPIAFIGPLFKSGIVKALEEVDYTVGGRKIVLIPEDVAADMNVALQKSKKLVERDRVNIIIGPLMGDAHMAIAPYLANKKVLTTSFYCGDLELTKYKNWFIFDIRYGRWDSIELINQMFDVVRTWGLRDFGIEQGHFKQILEPFIYKEMSFRQQFFDIQPIEHAKAGSKFERVKMIAPRYRAHTIYHPQNAPWLAELESELDGVTKDGFKSLFVDVIDALSMHEQIGEEPINNATGANLPPYAETDQHDSRGLPAYAQTDGLSGGA